MTNHCAVNGCSNSAYKLKKWKESHNKELDSPFKLFPFPTAKKNAEKEVFG